MDYTNKVHVNILSEAFHRDPHPFLHQMRSEEPVYYSEETRHWVLTRHDDVSEALRNAGNFSNQSSETFVVRPDFRPHLDALVKMFSTWAVMKDNPEHARLRGLINKAFQAESIGDIQRRTEDTTHWLIDRVEARGEMDFMNDYAFALPGIIFAEILGIDRSELPTVKAWGTNIASAAGRVDRLEVMLEGQKSCMEMASRVEAVIQDRMREPRKDFISYLIKEWREGGKLTLEEVIAQIVLLLAGGHTTTQNVIGGGLLALFKAPEQFARLKANPGMMKSAVEELFRFTSPAQCPTRIAACDLELRGRRIKQGEGVMPFIAAANRDPEVFEGPDTLNFERKKNPHLAFGSGIHVCPGAFLARSEIPIAYATLFARLPGIRPKTEEEDWNMNLSFRGLSTFPVCWS